MLRTGVDILDIERLNRMQEEYPAIYQRFLRRVFTPQELDAAQGNVERLAGIFAAKEAAAKALQCGIGSIGWQAIAIQHGANGEPELEFSGKARAILDQLEVSEWSVSISHTRQQAVAMVVLQ